MFICIFLVTPQDLARQATSKPFWTVKPTLLPYPGNPALDPCPTLLFWQRLQARLLVAPPTTPLASWAPFSAERNTMSPLELLERRATALLRWQDTSAQVQTAYMSAVVFVARWTIWLFDLKPPLSPSEPCSPGNVSVNYSMSTAQVRWGASRGARSYSVLAATDEGQTLTCNSTYESCSLTGLQCSHTYNITVMTESPACNSTVASAPYHLTTGVSHLY